MHSAKLIPELCVNDALAAIAFYKNAFGAKDLGTYTTPDGAKVMHSALEIDGAPVFVCDDFPEYSGGQARSAKALGGSPVTVHLNCDDVYAAWERAVQAGATVALPLEKQFWGDIYGIVIDPFGHRWSMCPTKGNVEADEQSDEYKHGAEVLYPTGAADSRKAKANKEAVMKKATKKSTKKVAKKSEEGVVDKVTSAMKSAAMAVRDVAMEVAEEIGMVSPKADAKKPVRKAGKKVAKKAKATAKQAGKTAKKAARSTKKTAKKAVTKAATTAKKVGKAAKKTAKKVGKTVKKTAKKASKRVGKVAGKAKK